MFNVKHKKKKLYPKEKKYAAFIMCQQKKLMCHITLSNVLLIYTYKPFIHIRTCHATNFMFKYLI